MRTEEALAAERDNLFRAVSINKQRYRDFLETMADHYKQPLETQVSLFLHAPADGRAYADAALWAQMGSPVKEGARGIDVLRPDGGISTVYELHETQEAERFKHLVWTYDESKDGAQIQRVGDAERNEGESTEDYIVRLCRMEAEKAVGGDKNLIAAGAAYIALSRMGFDAQKKVGLPLLIAPYTNIDGRMLLESTMQAAAPVLNHVAEVVRGRERAERERKKAQEAGEPKTQKDEKPALPKAAKEDVQENPKAPEDTSASLAESAYPEAIEKSRLRRAIYDTMAGQNDASIRETADFALSLERSIDRAELAAGFLRENDVKAQRKLQRVILDEFSKKSDAVDSFDRTMEMYDRIAELVEARIDSIEHDKWEEAADDVPGKNQQGSEGAIDGDRGDAESAIRGGVAGVPETAASGEAGGGRADRPDAGGITESDGRAGYSAGLGGRGGRPVGSGGEPREGDAPESGDRGEGVRGFPDGSALGENTSGSTKGDRSGGSRGEADGTARGSGIVASGESPGGGRLGSDSEGISAELPAGDVDLSGEEREGGAVPEGSAGKDRGELSGDLHEAGGRADGQTADGSRTDTGAQDDLSRGQRRDDRESVEVTPVSSNPADPYASIPIDALDFTADCSTTKGKRAVFARNLAAIRVMKEVEETGRNLTPLEEKLLRSYAGFGGLAEAFDPGNAQWAAAYKALRHAMTNEEYSQARKSSLDAFYTPPEVCKAIIKGVERLGFTSGNILEPSCGSGRFFDALPEEMRKKSHICGIELDPLTARIAKALHPDVDIAEQNFARSRFADGSFDLAIGNVPFGSLPINEDEKYAGKGILPHDYFILKMIDEVRDGGIVAAITSSGTMDKGSMTVRGMIAEKADLITAIRLPSNTFESAGTSVTTDLLVFRKKDGKEVAHIPYADIITSESPDTFLPGWENVYEEHDPSFTEPHTINAYLSTNPDHILGNLKERSARFGKELCVEATEGSLAEKITEIFEKLPQGAHFTPLETPLAPPVQAPDTSQRQMGYSIEAGRLVFTDLKGDTAEPDLTEAQKARVISAVNLRDMGYQLLDAQARGISSENLRAMQKKFREMYDAHHAKYGRIQKDRELKKLFQVDMGYSFLCGLEVYDKHKDFEHLSSIFTERTIAADIPPDHADSPEDALIISMNEKGSVDLPYMQELTGRQEEELVRALEYSHIFYDEEKREFVEANEYLSGDIYAKVDAQDDIIDEAKERISEICASARFKDVVEARNALSEGRIPPLPEHPTEFEWQMRDIVFRMLDADGAHHPNRAALKEMIQSADFEAHPERRHICAKYVVTACNMQERQDESLYVLMVGYRSPARHDKDFWLEVMKLDGGNLSKRGMEAWQRHLYITDSIQSYAAKQEEGKALLMQDKSFGEVADYIFRKNPYEVLEYIDAAKEAFEAVYKGREDEFESLPADERRRFFDEVYDKFSLAAAEDRAGDLLSNAEREDVSMQRARIGRAEKNIAALEAVRPERVPFGDIKFSLGSPWLDKKHVEDFIFDALEIDREYIPRGSRRWKPMLKVSYSEETSKWRIEPSSRFKQDYGAKGNGGYITPGMQTFSTGEKGCIELLNDCLNQKDTVVNGEDGKRDPELTVAAQMIQQKIQKAFREWIMKDVDRAKDVEDSYNARFNRIRLRQYDGSNLTFHHVNTIKLHPHQKDAIAHHLFGGNTLFAHCVGAGKTYEMIASIMESKKMGLSHKAMMVVPGHLVDQTKDAFRELYPRSRVLTPSLHEIQGIEGRKKLTAQIATQNIDAVILPFSVFERIKLGSKIETGYVEREMDRLEERLLELRSASDSTNPDKDFTIKEVIRRIDRLKGRLTTLMRDNQQKGDGSVPFEKLGIDKLVIDEAHYYKNLPIETRHSNVSGIGTTDKCDKAWDLYMKTMYMNEKTGCRGLIFATGTPIANSMTELYTLQRYLTPNVLSDAKIDHFDAWAASFADISTMLELRPEGMGYREKRRLRAFHNVPELMTQFKMFADVRTADMLPDRKVPEANLIIDKAPASAYQKQKILEFFARGEAIHDGRPNTVQKKDGSITDDSMLIITREGRELSLDPRIGDSAAEDRPDSKVNRCIRNVVKEHGEKEAAKGTQIIFCDDSTSTGVTKKRGAFNVYDDLRNKLIAQGIPKEEIAVVQEYSKDNLEEKVFTPMREGKIRVLIGSTDTLGVGTNVQTRLGAIHDLSVPWRPSDLEQRMGRAIRPGNENESVNIYRYITEGTFDAYMWQTLESKQKIISQMITSKAPSRSIVDMDEVTLSYADLKAISTDSPFLKEKMELENELVRIQIARAGYETTKKDLTEFIERKGPQQLDTLDARIAGLMKDKLRLEDNTEKNEKGEEVFRIKIGDKILDDPKKAAMLLHEVAKGGYTAAKNFSGVYKGMGLSVGIDSHTLEPFLLMEGAIFHRVAFAQTGKELNTVHNLEKVKGEIEKRIVKLKEEREPLARRMESAREKIKEPFSEELREQQIKHRLLEINEYIEQMKPQAMEHRKIERKTERKTHEEDRKTESPEAPSEAYDEEAAMTR